MRDPNGITEQKVISQLRAEGLEVTSGRLAYGRKQGLTPGPMQRGLGRGRGTVAIYSDDDLVHIRAMVQARARYRDSARVAWALWWQQFDVPPELVRNALVEQAKALDLEIDRLRSILKGTADAELVEEWDRLIEDSPSIRLQDPFLRGVRKRVRSDRFPTVLRIISEVATGLFEGFDVDPVTGYESGPTPVPKDGELVEKAFGLTRARKDRLPDLGSWLTEATEVYLLEISELFGKSGFDDLIAHLSDEELTQARDEFLRFGRVLGGFSRLAERVWGRHAFGMSVVGEYLGSEDPTTQQIGLLAWLRVMSVPELRAGATAFLAAEAVLEEGERAFGQLVQLVRWVPQFAEVVQPRLLRRAMRTAVSLERFNARLEQLYEANRKAVDEFRLRLSR